MSINILEIEEFFRHLEEVLDLPGLTLKGGEMLTRLEAWDSMAVLGFLAMADEQYGAVIPPKRISECKTIDDLAGLVRAFAK